MKWIKRGRLFEPAGQASWIGTHAALPVVDATDDRCRVYFCSRDPQGRSQIGYGDLVLDPSVTFGALSAEPVLRPGPLGAFDDAGVTTSCLVRVDGRAFLYYTGWSRGVSVPFYLGAGLAISDDGGEYRRLSPAPLLDRSPVDPYLTASPWVLIEGSVWRMWYVSGTAWEMVNGRPRHNYHINNAESRDGRDWVRSGVVCLDYAENEFAFGRPCVLRDSGAGAIPHVVFGARPRVSPGLRRVDRWDRLAASR